MLDTLSILRTLAYLQSYRRVYEVAVFSLDTS